jgi:transposase
VCGVCGRVQSGWYDRRVRRVRDLSCGAWRIYLELELRRVLCRSCARVKRERLEFLTHNALHTKRFAYLVGRRCRDSTIKEVADELHLDWDSVKELDKQYMRAQLARAGTPAPKVIGIDEISIRKRHTYRIVVSDLIRGGAIWFGGKDRSEQSMSEFFAWLGEKKRRGIRLAVMDMWKPFRNATEHYAPNAAILFDKFHVMRHLGKALDQVRKSEQLALRSEMAAAQTLREVRRDDRSSLGWDRGLLQAGEQGLARIRRGPEQQNPRHPASRIRTARRGIPTA